MKQKNQIFFQRLVKGFHPDLSESKKTQVRYMPPGLCNIYSREGSRCKIGGPPYSTPPRVVCGEKSMIAIPSKYSQGAKLHFEGSFGLRTINPEVVLGYGESWKTLYRRDILYSTLVNYKPTEAHLIYGPSHLIDFCNADTHMGER